MPRALVRHRIDFVSLGAVLANLGYASACCLAGAPALAALPMVLLSNWNHLVQHNQVHVPIFRNRRANEILGWLLTLGTAIPVEGYRLHHVEVHHRLAGTEADWTSPYAYRSARFPDRPVRLPWYILTYMARAWRRGVPEMWRRRHTASGKRFWRSIVVLGTFAVVMGILRPFPFLIFFGVPWIGNALAPAYFNWRHHRGCDHATKYTSSNVNLGTLSRGLGFNIGYHSVHHEYPALHWSLLRDRFVTEFAPHTSRERLVAASPARLRRHLIGHVEATGPTAS